jgi:DNA repair exonuclease SbcCD ATPase subunit
MEDRLQEIKERYEKRVNSGNYVPRVNEIEFLLEMIEQLKEDLDDLQQENERLKIINMSVDSIINHSERKDEVIERYRKALEEIAFSDLEDYEPHSTMSELTAKKALGVKIL